jgi:hypothetical protein
MTRVWDETQPAPEPLPTLAATGQACTPEGCA